VESLEETGFVVGDDAPDPGRRDDAEKAILTRLREFITAVVDGDRDVLIIAGQPGLGPHVMGAGARAYVDLHGLCLQELSAVADEVLLVVAGRTVRLEPDAVERAVEPSDASPNDTASFPELREHGDTQVPDGVVDLAVNVLPGPPTWLAERLAAAAADLAAYPDDTAARAAAAARHGRPPEQCLTVNGAAEAFWLIAQVLRPRLA